ncbi:MAG: hypothetical protein L0I76_17890 [Pseudonocardia sp.]|nr:hypothetical protein [Pseudonocardia sp.]
MPNGERPWRLERFIDELDAWILREDPSEDISLIVLPWIMSRTDDPYLGVRREQTLDNLWFGAIPGSEDGNGQVVACSYWLFERERVVRCNSIASLSLPL